jgi:O-antigen/teichoic acid export membrane protein
MSGGTSLSRTILSYTSAVMFCRVVGIVQSLVVIRWMEPQDLGVWLGLQLILIYGEHAHLGLLNAVNRQLPYHRGRDEFAAAEQIERVARGTLFLVVALGLLATIVMALTGMRDSGYGRGAILLTFTAAISLAIQFHHGLFRARNEFGRAGLASVVNALVILAGLPLVYYWRYDGLLWRVALAAVVSLIACLAMNRWDLRMAFSWKDTVSLVRAGAPIMVVVLGLSAFASMDRTLILWLLDDEAMGHYALCFAIARIMKLFPTTFGQVFYPRMTAIYASEGMSMNLVRRCVQASVLSGVVVTFLAAAAILTLPWVVDRFFPNYAAGIPALKIAMIAYVILSLAAGPTYFLISTVQKRRQITALLAGAAAMVLVATQAAPRTLEGIAWSLVAGTVVYIAALWSIVFASTRGARAARA